MNRIATIFADAGHKALIAYLTVGYPDIQVTHQAVSLLVKHGCDMVELGIPFSDPLADGATIQKASFKAIQNGVTPKICLQIARDLRSKLSAPLLFMSYYNPILYYGVKRFCSSCAASGIDGLIVPDLPPEEAVELDSTLAKYGLDLIYLLSPTSTEKRIRLAAQKSRGFIYLVTVTGITGVRQQLPPDLEEFIHRVRHFTDQPLCVGFGISNAAHVRQLARLADGVIIGSRIIQLLEANDSSLSALKSFIGEMRSALDAKE